MIDPEGFDKLASGIQHVVTTAGIVVGGIWVLYTFWGQHVIQKASLDVAKTELEIRKIEQDSLSADPRYLDVFVPLRVRKPLPVETERHAFAYVFEGFGTFSSVSQPFGVLTEVAHAAATTSRHVSMALKARCVLAEVRWRWTSKVFCVAACTERNLCADPTLLKPCILCSRRRIG